MARHAFTSKYRASQVAGSCRIEGIRVSARQEKTIRDVIDGKADSKAIRRKLVAQFKAGNNATVAVR